MFRSPLQVGVVGVGSIGRDQHLPGWAKVPFAKVVAVADISEAALKHSADNFGVEQTFKDWNDLVALPNVDVVDICTPNRLHTEIVIEALESGKHVLCEKPLATTAVEIQTMIAAAHKANRLLMPGQHLRFDGVSRQLKALIDDGKLGEIYYTRGQWLRRRRLPARPTFTDRNLSGGGPLLDIGVHILDLAFWFLGAPKPVAVSAFVGTKLAHQVDLGGDWGEWDHGRFDVEDFAAGFVRFANGATLMLETSWLGFQPEAEIIRLQCFGTRGGLVWPDGVLTGETRHVPWDLRLRHLDRGLAHHEEIMAFAAAVRDGLPSPVPPRDSLEVVRILEALYLSGQTQREVLL